MSTVYVVICGEVGRSFLDLDVLAVFTQKEHAEAYCVGKFGTVIYESILDPKIPNFENNNGRNPSRVF